MRRGQIAGRLLMILASWIIIILGLVFMYILAAVAETGSVSAEESIGVQSVETTLNTFLRQSVAFAGDQVPMAERIAIAAMIDDRDAIKQFVDEYIDTFPSSDVQQIFITYPDGNRKPYGELGASARKKGDIRSASTILPLPNGKEITVEYAEFSVTPAGS